LVIEQFTVQPPFMVNSMIVGVVLIVVGVVLLVSNVLLYGLLKSRSAFGGKMMGIGIGVDSKYGLALLGWCY